MRKKGSNCRIELSMSLDHQSRVKEKRNKQGGTFHWSQPASALICLVPLLRLLHCLSSCFLSGVIPCKRCSTSHSVSLFSHSLMALEPAMLPWEPVGDSRRPLHLFPFIPFWKWIKCFLFRLAWKMCPDSKVLKCVHSRCLI